MILRKIFDLTISSKFRVQLSKFRFHSCKFWVNWSLIYDLPIFQFGDQYSFLWPINFQSFKYSLLFYVTVFFFVLLLFLSAFFILLSPLLFCFLSSLLFFLFFSLSLFFFLLFFPLPSIFSLLLASIFFRCNVRPL